MLSRATLINDSFRSPIRISVRWDRPGGEVRLRIRGRSFRGLLGTCHTTNLNCTTCQQRKLFLFDISNHVNLLKTLFLDSDFNLKIPAELMSKSEIARNVETNHNIPVHHCPRGWHRAGRRGKSALAYHRGST